MFVLNCIQRSTAPIFFILFLATLNIPSILHPTQEWFKLHLGINQNVTYLTCKPKDEPQRKLLYVPGHFVEFVSSCERHCSVIQQQTQKQANWVSCILRSDILSKQGTGPATTGLPTFGRWIQMQNLSNTQASFFICILILFPPENVAKLRMILIAMDDITLWFSHGFLRSHHILQGMQCINLKRDTILLTMFNIKLCPLCPMHLND